MLTGCGSGERAAQPQPDRPCPGRRRGGKLTIGISFDQPGIGLKDGDTLHRLRRRHRDLRRRRRSACRRRTSPGRRRTATSASGCSTTGEADLVVSTFSITDERKKLVDFAGPYFVAHQDLLVRRNETEITGPETLDGKNLCSVRARRRRPRHGASTGAPSHLMEFPRFSDCVKALANSQVDAVTTDDVILAGFAAEPQYQGKLKVIGKGFSDELYGVGIKKGDTDDGARRSTPRCKQYIADGSWKKSLDSTVRPSGLLDPEPADAGGPLTGDRAVHSACGRRRPSTGTESDEGTEALVGLLRRHPPFDALPDATRAEMAARARTSGGSRPAS